MEITHPNKVEARVEPKAGVRFEPKSKLDEAVEMAKNATGYMILISRLNRDKLNHTYFTSNFRRGDIMPSLDEHAKNLEPEVK